MVDVNLWLSTRFFTSIFSIWVTRAQWGYSITNLIEQSQPYVILQVNFVNLCFWNNLISSNFQPEKKFVQLQSSFRCRSIFQGCYLLLMGAIFCSIQKPQIKFHIETIKNFIAFIWLQLPSRIVLFYMFFVVFLVLKLENKQI